ncbi:hypothetical protein [Streptomyces sp. MA15]|uniref:hypothetical protein n=1 Tax=Streptomyces sp. MA15 TaxID=3055061 RepID=UPI00339D6887
MDTHRHAWEAQLRRIMPDVDDLAGYVTTTLLGYAPVYRPRDMYVGTRLAVLTAIDSGITTMLDFSHNSRTAAHSDAAVRAGLQRGRGHALSVRRVEAGQRVAQGQEAARPLGHRPVVVTHHLGTAAGNGGFRRAQGGERVAHLRYAHLRQEEPQPLRVGGRDVGAPPLKGDHPAAVLLGQRDRSARGRTGQGGQDAQGAIRAGAGREVERGVAQGDREALGGGYGTARLYQPRGAPGGASRGVHDEVGGNVPGPRCSCGTDAYAVDRVGTGSGHQPDRLMPVLDLHPAQSAQPSSHARLQQGPAHGQGVQP